MNKFKAFIFIALLSSSVRADLISLDFSSLPSAQGWTYTGDVSEMTAFSVSGGILIQDTFGGSDNSSTPRYGITDVVAPLLPYTLKVTARVTAYSTSINDWPYAFGLAVVNGNGEKVTIGINTNRIGANANGNNPNIFSSSIDNTQFHDYRLEGTPSVGWEFFVDNIPIGSGSFLSAATNGVGFGDLTTVGRARVEITNFSFSQPSVIPEPSTFVLFFTILFGLEVVRRKQRIPS